MNIQVYFKGVFLGVKENKTEKGVYYSIALECNGDAGNLSCTKEVYDIAKELVKYTSYLFESSFNSAYKNLRVIGVVQAEDQVKDA